MGRDSRHADQMRRANQARRAAVQRLILQHPEEYRDLYEEEARKRGVTTARRRRADRIKKLRDELNKLEGK